MRERALALSALIILMPAVRMTLSDTASWFGTMMVQQITREVPMTNTSEIAAMISRRTRQAAARSVGLNARQCKLGASSGKVLEIFARICCCTCDNHQLASPACQQPAVWLSQVPACGAADATACSRDPGSQSHKDKTTRPHEAQAADHASSTMRGKHMMPDAHTPQVGPECTHPTVVPRMQPAYKHASSTHTNESTWPIYSTHAHLCAEHEPICISQLASIACGTDPTTRLVCAADLPPFAAAHRMQLLCFACSVPAMHETPACCPHAYQK